MIVVEGPDGGGKTSLISVLAEELDFKVMPRPCTSDNAVDPETLREWVDKDLSLPVHHHGFYDRHPLISEPIYGPLIRGRMADGFSDMNWLRDRLRMFRQRDPLLIFCIPPLGQVLENIVKGHDHSTKHLRGVHTHARALYELYCARAAMESSNPFTQVFLWDYTNQDSDLRIAYLIELCKGYL